MNKYIKKNANNEIIDVFFEYQKQKLDGTEIFLEDTETIEHKINGQSISNDYGVYLFTYIDSVIADKLQADIDDDPKTLDYNIKVALENLNETDKDIPRGLEDLMDALDSTNVFKKTDANQELQDKLADKKAKRAAYQALIT